jgi:hypothetical protein
LTSLGYYWTFKPIVPRRSFEATNKKEQGMKTKYATCTPYPEPVVDNASDSERDRICKAVLARLGTPHDLHSVKATKVYGDNWRVNVRRVVDPNAFVPVVQITDSFFLRGGSVDDVDAKY